jgi:hypothetical protein
MQRYNQALQTEKQPLPQQHIALAHRANNTTSITLEDALAQDHKRRQQEQSIQAPSNNYQHSPIGERLRQSYFCQLEIMLKIWK